MTGCTITVNPTAGGPGANVAVSLASLIEAAVPSIIDGNLDSAYPVVHLAIKSAGVIPGRLFLLRMRCLNSFCQVCLKRNLS